jgi:hypothetical protein
MDIISGAIGTSGVSYDVSLDASLVLAAGLKVPLKTVLDAVVAQMNSPIATEVEKGLIAAIQLYLASQPAAPAVTAPA